MFWLLSHNNGIYIVNKNNNDDSRKNREYKWPSMRSSFKNCNWNETLNQVKWWKKMKYDGLLNISISTTTTITSIKNTETIFKKQRLAYAPYVNIMNNMCFFLFHFLYLLLFIDIQAFFSLNFQWIHCLLFQFGYVRLSVDYCFFSSSFSKFHFPRLFLLCHNVLVHKDNEANKTKIKNIKRDLTFSSFVYFFDNFLLL